MKRKIKRSEQIAVQLLRCCGAGRYLCLTKDAGAIVSALRIRGVEAEEGPYVDTNAENYDVLVCNFPESYNNDSISPSLLSATTKRTIFVAFIADLSIGKSQDLLRLCRRKMVDAGFVLHPKQKLPDADNKELIQVFRREPRLVSPSDVIQEDLYRHFDIHSDIISTTLLWCTSFITDSSYVIVSGFYAGALGYIVRSCTLAAHVIEMHEGSRSQEYFNIYYSWIRNNRIIIDTNNQNENKIHKASIIIHTSTRPLLEEKFIIANLLSQLTIGGRIILIIDRTKLKSNSDLHKHLVHEIKTIFGEQIEIDFCRSPREKIHPVLLFALKIPKGALNISNAVNGEKGLSHPWVSSSLITCGKRFLDSQSLTRHALEVCNASIALSAQEGAALCVLVYRYIDMASDGKYNQQILPQLDEKIIRYLSEAPSHQRSSLRWLISLSYAYANLLHLVGRPVTAVKYYQQCILYDPLIINPQMSGKTIDSFICLAKFSLIRKDYDEASYYFEKGLDLAKKVIGSDWELVLGSDQLRPFRFGMPEIAGVISLAAKCAHGLNVLSANSTDPGLIWSIIESL